MNELLKSSAIILASVTSLLYATDAAFLNGLLTELKIPSNIFSQNLYQSLYEGSVIFSNNYSITIVMVIIGLILSIPMLILISKIDFEKYVSAPEWLKDKKENANFWALFDFLVPIIILLALFLSLRYVFYSFQEEGKTAAVKMLAKVKSKNLTDQKIVEIKGGESIEKAIIIRCDSSFCAGLKEDGTKIIYFSINDILSTLL